MTPYLPRNHIVLLFLEKMGNISQKANVSFNVEESKSTKIAALRQTSMLNLTAVIYNQTRL